MRSFTLAVLASLTVGSPIAWAGMPVPEKMTCPIGGERFTHISTASYSRWGERPDGKPYGSWEFPLAIPVCPGNGLVLYKAFSKDELERLKPLIASPEYRQMAINDTPYYRAGWLAHALDPATANRAWWLLSASWETDGDPVRKARYQREFIAAAAKMTAKPADLEWLVLQARVINAHRELGEFDQALSLLKSLSLASLDVPLPAEKVSGQTASGLGKRIENHEEIEAARNKRAWLEHFQLLETVIARRDASAEPLDMIPLREAAGKCGEMGEAAAAEAMPQGFCTSELVIKEIKELEELKAALEKDRAN